MWEWREERGRWRLDDSGSWNWDEPSLLARVGPGPFGPAGPAAPTMGRPSPPPPPVPPPPPPSGPWVPPERWRREPPVPPRGPEPDDGPGFREVWDELMSSAPPALERVPAEWIAEEETPIFAAVAEDHERDEATGEQRLRPSRHGVGEPGHPGADDRREYRTAPWIPDPSPGSGPFAMPIARHARAAAGSRPDDADRVDGRHALRR